MTGPQHYAKAEEHLAKAAAIETDGDEDSMSAWHQRQAQVHMTAALVASIADPLSYGNRSDERWTQVFR